MRLTSEFSVPFLEKMKTGMQKLEISVDWAGWIDAALLTGKLREEEKLFLSGMAERKNKKLFSWSMNGRREQCKGLNFIILLVAWEWFTLDRGDPRRNIPVVIWVARNVAFLLFLVVPVGNAPCSILPISLCCVDSDFCVVGVGSIFQGFLWRVRIKVLIQKFRLDGVQET